MSNNLLLRRELDFKSEEEFHPHAKRYTYEIVVYNKYVRENQESAEPKKLPWDAAWASNVYFVVRNSALPEENIRKLARNRFPDHQGFVIVDVYRISEME